MNGLLLPFPFVLYRHNVPLGGVGIRYLDGYGIELVTQSMVVFRSEWLPRKLPTVHSPCIERRLQVELVFRVDDWNEARRHGGS